MTWRSALILASLVTLVTGHGRVLDPVSRASAWRKGFSTPQNYDDDGLNCGGMAHQWATNGGRCGICGDAYDIPTPRPHELGGKYGEGVIVAAFNPGSIISAAVQLTASHRGFWEFKICPDPEVNEQGCFNKYPLELEEGGTRYYPTQGAKTYRVNYRLPQGLKCEHCVLQWRYTAGNNWGTCPNGTQGLGCGDQEQFGACSDITIGSGANDFYNTVSIEDQNEVFDYPDVKGWDLELNNDLNLNKVLGDGSQSSYNYEQVDNVFEFIMEKARLSEMKEKQEHDKLELNSNVVEQDLNKVNIVGNDFNSNLALDQDLNVIDIDVQNSIDNF